MMRQTMYIFDLKNRKVGYTRSKCSEDLNMILKDDEIYLVNKANKGDPEWYNCVMNQFMDNPIYYSFMLLFMIIGLVILIKLCIKAIKFYK